VSCVRRKNIEMRDAKLLDDIGHDQFRVGARIADRDQARLDTGRLKAIDPAQCQSERAAALEIDPVFVVDFRRTVQADRDMGRPIWARLPVPTGQAYAEAAIRSPTPR
jgi:hypothetical protein